MNILIVGAGYTGLELGRRLASAGHIVTGWTLTKESAQKSAAAGMTAVAADIYDHDQWLRHKGDWELVVFALSTRGGGVDDYRKIYSDGVRRVFQETAYSRKMIYLSSTSVYGQTDGSDVGEDSPAFPMSPTGDVLIEAEDEVLRRRGTVLRLGAIYGPGRAALLNRFLDGDFAVPHGRYDRWINQIHRDDICSAVEHIIAREIGDAEIYNVVDDHPAAYREIFDWLAQRTGKPWRPSEASAPARRGSANRRVLNHKLRATGWSPAYASFRGGYATLLPRS